MASFKANGDQWVHAGKTAVSGTIMSRTATIAALRVIQTIPGWVIDNDGTALLFYRADTPDTPEVESPREFDLAAKGSNGPRRYTF